MNKAQVEALLEAAQGISEEQKNKMVCAVAGHSDIVNTCFGQVTCGRCDEILGDSLTGNFNMSDKVIIGHDCATCRSVFKKLDWRSKFRTPHPFKAET